MRALALALLLLSCEANPPQVWTAPVDATAKPDTVDPSGDSDCPPMPARWVKVKECEKYGQALVGDKCRALSNAHAVCEGKGACYDGYAGLCVLCVQP